MIKTVVAIYDCIKQAWIAADGLLNLGFNERDVDVISADIISHNQYGPDRHSHWFINNLFGTVLHTHDHTDLPESGTVVSVAVHSPDKAEQATRLLHNYGALSVGQAGYGQHNRLENLGTNNHERRFESQGWQDDSYGPSGRIFKSDEDFERDVARFR